MPALPALKGHEVVQALLRAGFYIHHQRGSHTRLFHRDRAELRVTVPVHNKDIPEKTLRAILKQADLTDEGFLKLLRD
jgi:predicted RNA binding protein YcfA (HicA-like mRNA interferase family)